MQLLFDKEFKDLDLKTDEYFLANNISKTPGSIAKLLMNLINTNHAELYETLSINHVLTFLSSSQGNAIDEIGFMLNCKRLVDETDDAYKYRISKWILRTATANETAIRLAALGVLDVQDVVMKKFSYGSGSFTILILTNNVTASESVIANVRAAVEEVTGYGINFEIVNPDIKYVSIKVKLLLKDIITNNSDLDVFYLTQDRLRMYLLSIPIGEPIITNEITRIILDANSNTVSYICKELRIDGKISMFINQDCRWNERFMLSQDANAIMID